MCDLQHIPHEGIMQYLYTTEYLYNVGNEHKVVLNTAKSSPHLLNRRHTKNNCGEVYLSNTATIAYVATCNKRKGDLLIGWGFPITLPLYGAFFK